MVNFSFTAVGMTLVDRKGRKFLFILGTSGIILSMVTVGTIFLRTESRASIAAARSRRSLVPGRTSRTTSTKPRRSNS